MISSRKRIYSFDLFLETELVGELPADLVLAELLAHEIMRSLPVKLLFTSGYQVRMKSAEIIYRGHRVQSRRREESASGGRKRNAYLPP